MLSDSGILADSLINLQISLFVKSASGKYLSVNRAARQLINFPEKEIIGQDDFKFFEAASASIMRDRDVHILNSKNVLCYESSAILLNQSEPCKFLSLKYPLLSDSVFGEGLLGISIKFDNKDYEDTRTLMNALMHYRAKKLEQLCILQNRACSYL